MISGKNPAKDTHTEGTIPWVEKYRPRRIDQLIQHDRIRKNFNKIKENGNMSHMLLYGPSGTGKTSSVFALMRELYGPRIIKNRVLELNASDSRGIKIVRNKITNFAKLHMGNADPLYPSPPFKVIILDEADAMTNDAQSALRKLMESTIHITRFILICNYENQIMSAIKSRCAKFRFNKISTENAFDKLKNIAKSEKLNIEDSALRLIAHISDGDVRAAINILQNMRYINKKVIDEKCVKSTTSYLDHTDMTQLWNITLKEDVKTLYLCAKEFINKGFPIKYVLCALSDKMNQSKKLTDIQKAKINISIAHCERRILEGSSQVIQLLSVLTYINGIYRKNIDNIEIKTF
jgi:replication factor C subunit 2/4